jgi:hypothetical protein
MENELTSKKKSLMSQIEKILIQNNYQDEDLQMMNWIDCPRLSIRSSGEAAANPKLPDQELPFQRAQSQMAPKIPRSIPPPKIPLKSSVTTFFKRD